MKTFSFESTLPPSFFNTPLIVGVDEAGRGPVLGPMVYSIFFMPKENENELALVEVDDSKVLKEEHRLKKFHDLKSKSNLFAYAYTAISPQDLSKWMLRRKKYNLNSIAHDTTISLISKLVGKGVHVDSIFVDTVGPAISYEKKLRAEFPKVSNITVAAKADALYPVVSAASIIAKVTRDELLDSWEFSETMKPIYLNRDWGSGYPSDPKTISWLTNTLDPVFGWDGIVRFSWSTAHQLLEKVVKVDHWPEERTMLQLAEKSMKSLKRPLEEETPVKQVKWRDRLGIQPLTLKEFSNLFS
ncbi:Ribonuclease H2 subunit A [Coelomomyces lativittatus]|nr:Ribonuclease H2 subunit A [Coelomomyces lativittatus]